jgi:hypothetical protein
MSTHSSSVVSCTITLPWKVKEKFSNLMSRSASDDERTPWTPRAISQKRSGVVITRNGWVCATYRDGDVAGAAVVDAGRFLQSGGGGEPAIALMANTRRTRGVSAAGCAQPLRGRQNVAPLSAPAPC